MTDKLAVLGQVEQRLASIETLDEAKHIRDQAEAIRIYAKSAKRGLAIQNKAAKIKILAERRGGELIRAIPREQGKRGGTSELHTTLVRSDIPAMTAHRWEAMAEVPVSRVSTLEAELTEANKELTSSLVFKMGRKAKAPPESPKVVTPGFPDGPFRCIVIDPPWPVEKIVLDRRPVEQERMDYATWTLDEIKALPIEKLADKRGAHIYLWVTHKFLPFGLNLFESWGVRYECLLTWIKPTAQPLWWKYNTEHALFGKVASLAPLEKGTAVGFTAPQQRHSHKPDEFFGLVRKVSPEPRLTMFDDAREGFERWGHLHKPA